MCGISAVTGHHDIVQILYDSIHNLEYRGYDSCGLGVVKNGKLEVRKNTGGVEEVNEKERLTAMVGKTGIAHTRWATHGKVTQSNAHPHTSADGRFSLVHNGIVNNYLELRQELSAQGISFVSQTDTEVVAQLIGRAYAEFQDVEEAFLAALARLEGNFAVAMVTPLAPDTIFAVREGSPLVIGLADGKNFVASDQNAFLPYTREAVIMEDGEYATITPAGARIAKMATRAPVSRRPLRIEWDLETSRKGGFAHYMLKEIFDQPQTIVNALNSPQQGIATLAGTIAEADSTYLMGVGTTHYVAMMGQYFFSRLAGVYLPAVSSDEFTELAVVGDKDLLISISQSGETYDTRRSVKYAQERGARTASIVNVMGSTLSQMADQVIMQNSGPEICVVSTKAALAQMIILLRVAMELGREKGKFGQQDYDRVYAALTEFPAVVERALNEKSGLVRNLTKRTSQFASWLFLGAHLPVRQLAFSGPWHLPRRRPGGRAENEGNHLPPRRGASRGFPQTRYPGRGGRKGGFAFFSAAGGKPFPAPANPGGGGGGQGPGRAHHRNSFRKRREGQSPAGRPYRPPPGRPRGGSAAGNRVRPTLRIFLGARTETEHRQAPQPGQIGHGGIVSPTAPPAKFGVVVFFESLTTPVMATCVARL